MAAILQVVVSQQANAVIISLRGEAHLDLESAATQIDRVIAQRPALVIVDCSQLTFLSSMGMSLLVNLCRSVAAQGGTAKLAAINPQVRGALDHAHLSPLLPIYADMASALAGDASN